MGYNNENGHSMLNFNCPLTVGNQGLEAHFGAKPRNPYVSYCLSVDAQRSLA